MLPTEQRRNAQILALSLCSPESHHLVHWTGIKTSSLKNMAEGSWFLCNKFVFTVTLDHYCVKNKLNVSQCVI